MNTLKELEAKYKELGEEIEKLKSEKIKPKFWRPENGKEAWFIGLDGSIHSLDNWKNKEATYNNVYPTKEEAIEARDMCLCEMRLKEAIFNLNGGEVCEFVYDQNNFCVGLHDSALSANTWAIYKVHPNWFYLKNSEDIEKLIASHEDDLLMWLGR